MDAPDLAMIREAITGLSRQVSAGVRSAEAITVTFMTMATFADPLAPGDRVLLHRVSESQRDAYQVYTLRGEKAGQYSFSEPTEKLRELLAAPELLDTVIESVEARDKGVRFRVRVSPV